MLKIWYRSGNIKVLAKYSIHQSVSQDFKSLAIQKSSFLDDCKTKFIEL